MKNISVYLRNHIDGPSCYYRVVQFTEHIDNVNFKINDALNVHDFRKNMDEKNRTVKKILQFFFLLLHIHQSHPEVFPSLFEYSYMPFLIQVTDCI